MARPRGDIAPRILHAARHRFLIEGVDGASLRGIAADAGTNIGMVYYYFPTKDDLFLAVVEEVYTGVLAGLATALDQKLPVDERLQRLFTRMGTLSLDEAEVLRLVIREALASPARLSHLIARFRRGHVPLLIDLVREGMRTGHLRTDLPPAALLVATVALAGPAQVLFGLVCANLGPNLDQPGGAGLPSARAGSATGATPPASALLETLWRGIAGAGSGTRTRVPNKRARPMRPKTNARRKRKTSA
jgi:AcrR family transcriptional regulator